MQLEVSVSPDTSCVMVGRPPKPAVTPSVKMRNVFWTRVPDAKVDDTVWKDLSDDKVRWWVRCVNERNGCRD